MLQVRLISFSPKHTKKMTKLRSYMKERDKVKNRNLIQNKILSLRNKKLLQHRKIRVLKKEEGATQTIEANLFLN